MRKNNNFTWDQDWPLAWLVWSPEGIEEYLKEDNRFQKRFGLKYTRKNVSKNADKLALIKFDPIVRRKVMFTETKIK